MAENQQNSPERKTMEFVRFDEAALHRIQIDWIDQLEQQRVVDQHFRFCHSMKNGSSSSFFLDLVTTYLIDAQTAVDDMTNKLCQDVVDFDNMYTSYIKIKGSSECLGVCRMSAACSRLGLAIDNRSKEGCFEVLRLIRDELKIVGDQFNSIIKIEQELVRRGN